MDNAKLMSSTSPYDKEENSAIELFLQMAHDGIYDSEDEVILNFVEQINKEYVKASFIKKWTTTYLDFLKVLIVKKISEELEGKSEEIIAEYADLTAKIVSELDNPLYILAKRLGDSPVMAEAMVFFRKHDINYKEIYDSVMSQYALDLFHEIQQGSVEETGATGKKHSSEDISDKDKTVSDIQRNLPIISTLLHDKLGAGAKDILNNDKKLTEVVGEIHNMLPDSERLAIKKQALINYCLENRRDLVTLEEPDNATFEPESSEESHNQNSDPSTNKILLIVKKNPIASKAILGVAGALVLGLFLFPLGEKNVEQTASQSSSIDISKQEGSKALKNKPVLADSEATKPANLSVFNSVIAKEIDSNNSPRFISDSFANMKHPLYYHFSYKGKIDKSKLEVRLLQNDIEQFSQAQPEIKLLEEKAWLVINEELQPGEWVLKLYADGKVINFTKFSILNNNSQSSKGSESGKKMSSSLPQDTLKNGSSIQMGQLDERSSKAGEQYVAQADGSESSIEEVKPKEGLVFIWPTPANSRIRILNIKPKYKQGMKLPPGKYHIEVSATGYQTNQKWITLGSEEIKKLKIKLEPIKIAPPPESEEKKKLEQEKNAKRNTGENDGKRVDSSEFFNSWETE